MKIFTCFLFVAPFYFSVFAQVNPAQEWQNLERQIRDGKIAKVEAARAMAEANEKIRQYLKEQKFERTLCDSWVFPLRGHNVPPTIDKDRYAPKDYDFFDGNRHKGHPAYDIFIKDKDFDCIEDETCKFAETIVSISSGVVVSVNNGWKYPSDIRGGNYIYIYDDVSDRVFYYAHLNHIFVNLGQIVNAGDVLGTLGRTGKNAYPHRSPTHLHLMVLDAGTMQPIDFYNK